MEISTLTPISDFARETPSETLSETSKQISKETPKEIFSDRSPVTHCRSCQQNTQVKSCQFCHHFDITGRRGGECTKLQSHVEGNWQACSLAIPIFLAEAIAPEEIPFYLSPTVLTKMLPSISLSYWE